MILYSNSWSLDCDPQSCRGAGWWIAPLLEGITEVGAEKGDQMVILVAPDKGDHLVREVVGRGVIEVQKKGKFFV